MEVLIASRQSRLCRGIDVDLIWISELSILRISTYSIHRWAGCGSLYNVLYIISCKFGVRVKSHGRVESQTWFAVTYVSDHPKKESDGIPGQTVQKLCHSLTLASDIPPEIKGNPSSRRFSRLFFGNFRCYRTFDVAAWLCSVVMVQIQVMGHPRDRWIISSEFLLAQNQVCSLCIRMLWTQVGFSLSNCLDIYLLYVMLGLVGPIWFQWLLWSSELV